ncbi:MAG: hypothetical protein QOD42_2948 [Sphingomonadales bacterium]|jgi:hypothetical protein|nr:hypothetical protein [Sphingomonadales bacterium]
MPEKALTQILSDFRTRPSPSALVRAARAIFAQGRAIETAYGAACFMARRPSAETATGFAAPLRRAVTRMRTESVERALLRWRAALPLLDRWIAEVPIRFHGAARVGAFTAAGEYGEGAPRLFLLSPRGMTISDHYAHNPGVRHVHCVHPLGPDSFLVATGDSCKYLDEWRIEDGCLVFAGTRMRFLGGFTAAGTAAGEVYLGSDFTSRPNYLLRLRDRRKFFMPAPAFLHYVYRLEVVADRYVVAAGKSLDIAGGARSISVFDAKAERFVADG